MKRLCGVAVALALLLAMDSHWANNARGESLEYPGEFSPAEIGMKASKYALSKKHGYASALNLVTGREDINYPMVCSRYGVLIFGEASGDKTLLEAVQNDYRPFVEGNRKPRQWLGDYYVFGIVPFELYRQTGDKAYLKLALSQADGEFKRLRPDGLSKYSRFWVDDMWMIGSLQLQGYKSLKETKYADRTVDLILAYTKALQHENGLYRHNLKSPYFWGRGNGWAAAAMAETLEALPEDYRGREEIMTAYKKQMAGLIKTQDAEGMWRQLLDDPSSYAETSATSMFVFAMATGVRNGWLPREPYLESTQRAWRALVKRVGSDGALQDICIATMAKNDKSFYLNRPRRTGDLHGQAGLIWASTAMLKLEKATKR